MHEAGKGSAPRPISVDPLKYKERWDAIFKNPQIEEELKKSIDAK